MSSKKQTAVEWLISELDMDKFMPDHITQKIQQALAMEKEQHNATWVDSGIVITHEKDPQTFEEYYRETYEQNS